MFFYYAHSILKPLSKDLSTLTKNVFNVSSLKMILAIPLIPTNYVIPGFEALRKWMREKNVDLNSICDFVYAQWLAEGAERISIFHGLAHSINNHTQVFNRELINAIGSGKTFESEFVEKLLRISSKSFVKFSKSSESHARKAQKLQKIVKFATKSWISSPFHLRRPIQFLQQISHCIDDGMINFVANYCDEIQKVEEKVEKICEPPPLIYFEKCEKNQSDKIMENSQNVVG